MAKLFLQNLPSQEEIQARVQGLGGEEIDVL